MDIYYILDCIRVFLPISMMIVLHVGVFNVLVGGGELCILLLCHLDLFSLFR